jgi:hypothetical protein
MSTSTITTTKLHWLFRVGDGTNLKNSSRYQIWGIKSRGSGSKNFMKNARQGDILWFIKGASHGRAIAFATYNSHNNRQLGPLIDLSLNNEELGWSGGGDISDVEIKYTNLYNIYNLNICTELQNHLVIRKYNPEEYEIDLIQKYNDIVNIYNNVSREL